MNLNKTYYALIPLLQSQSVLRAQKIKHYKKLTRPVATYGAESRTVNRDVAKTADCFWKRRFKKNVLGGIKVNGNWRKRCNKELMQFLGNWDILSFARINPLNLIEHVNRMDCKWRVSQVINDNPQGNQLRGRPKNRWGICVQMNINRREIKILKERSKDRVDWAKSIKEVKFRTGLYCHIWRIRIRWRRRGGRRRRRRRRRGGSRRFIFLIFVGNN